MTAFTRRSFSGTAPDSTLTSPMDGVTLTATCANLTGWPDGSAGNFVVIFEPGTVNEEKCLAASRTGNVLTLVARAMEGSAVAHNSTTSTVRHGYSARDADEANNTANQTLGAIAAKGDLLVGSAANTLTKLAIGSTGQVPTVSGGTLVYATPSTALTSLSGILSGADVPISSGGSTVFTTASLATGTWLLTPTLTVWSTTTAGTYTLQPTGGSATYSGNALTMLATTTAANQNAVLAGTYLLVVTVAGTVAIFAAGPSGAVARGSNFCGYTAVKIA